MLSFDRNLMRPEVDISEVAQDFRERSLSFLDSGLAKLVYLSSCRDYNSGLYRHDGLASEFSETAVHETLALVHRNLFEELSPVPLEQWVDEMRNYLETTDPNSARIWKELRPYHLLVPIGTSTIAVELVMSNLKIALELLQSQPRLDLPSPE